MFREIIEERLGKLEKVKVKKVRKYYEKRKY
jgi:hypothetical protein